MTDLYKYKTRLEQRLDELLAPINREGWGYIVGEASPILLEAMRYSLLGGGKRLRPMMFLTMVELLSGPVEEALDLACALEMIHTYSLIHDDLPGMDNDTLRRGRKTNHVVFGEGQAILAGDGLLNYAYEVMLKAALQVQEPEQQRRFIAAVSDIAAGAGIKGMISGQAEDLFSEEQDSVSRACLEYIQTNKTAAMFAYPMRAAGRLSAMPEQALHDLYAFGLAYGALFQATDDLLDVTGTVESMGKSIGKDIEENKKTCITLYGLEGTKVYIRSLEDAAIASIRSALQDRSEVFIELIRQTTTRIS